MEITDATEPAKVAIALEFLKPLKATNTKTFSLVFTILVREDGTVADIMLELLVLTGFAVATISVAGFRLRRLMSTI